MEFLTKEQIRRKLEDFLLYYDNKYRFSFIESYNDEKEFIHIGEPVERTLSKYQTFLNKSYDKNEDNEKSDLLTQYEKNVKQGNFLEKSCPVKSFER